MRSSVKSLSRGRGDRPQKKGIITQEDQGLKGLPPTAAKGRGAGRRVENVPCRIALNTGLTGGRNGNKKKRPQLKEIGGRFPGVGLPNESQETLQLLATVLLLPGKGKKK